jgi:hypothetical protein
MKLPNAHLAIVEEKKVVEYLLNPVHPDNGGKAAFFQTLGFDRDDWRAFAAALRQVGVNGEVVRTVESPHGTKYVVDGRIDTPRARAHMVRSIWIVDRGLEAPRLVTTYAREEEKQP